MTTSSHGLNAYSTFSESRINSPPAHRDQKKGLHKCLCFLCTLSTSLTLHPVGPFRCVWDMIVMSLLVYTSIEIPFTMAFGQSTYIFYIGLFVDAILFIDILLNFHTAYFDKYDNLILITNKKYICKKYFRTWFVIDFVTCIPYELFYQLDSNNDDATAALTYIKILRIFRLLRIIKILRLLKMLRIFDVFKKQFIVREILISLRIFKIIFGMLIFAHFAACLWWFTGSRTSPSWIDEEGLRSSDVDTFTKYSFSWYWAVVTLFTTGYGDIVATNTTEQWVSSICILIGTCFFAYFVGTLTVLITEGDKIRSFEIDKIEEAQLFCEKKRLPKELSHAICSHIRYHARYNYVFDETDLLDTLPSYLRHDINSCVAKQFLINIGIFQNEYIQLPAHIIGAIAIKCQAISCNQCFKLYAIDDIAKEFYIQRTGKSVMYDKNGNILKHISRGDVCGEYSSILFKKRKVKVQCETWSEFYSISIDDIKQILDEYYPKSSHLKWRRIKQYVKISYEKRVKHIVRFNEYIKDVDENAHTTARQITTKNKISINCKLDTPIKLNNKNDNERECQKRSVTKLDKFKIRTNSNLRNIVVIAHGQKHNKLNTPHTSPRESIVPNINRVSENVLEMSDIVSGGNNFNYKIEKIQSETIYSAIDSECSLSSVSSASFSDIQSNIDKALRVKKRVTHNNKQRNIKKGKRKKIGKFGGRKGGNFKGRKKRNNNKGLCRSQTYSRVDIDESESDCEEKVEGKIKENDEVKIRKYSKVKRNRMSSLDSSILLATYDSDIEENNENEECINNDNDIINQENVKNDKDVDGIDYKKRLPVLTIRADSVSLNEMTKNQTVK
eukprot:55151_1